MSGQQNSGVSRRGFVGALGTGATILAATPFIPGGANAQSQTGVPATAAPKSARTRTIPRTQQTLTTLGLGTFLTFDARPGDDRRRLGEVFRRYVAGGGRVIDTSPLYGSAEVSVGAFLAGTPEASEIFVANKIWSTGEYLGDESHAVASFEQSRLRIWRDTIDLMQCHSIVNAAVSLDITLNMFLGLWHCRLRAPARCHQVWHSARTRLLRARTHRASQNRATSVTSRQPRAAKARTVMFPVSIVWEA